MGERPALLPISRVTLGLTRWRAKVVVIDKTDTQTSRCGHKTQKVLLQDEEGTMIEAILWNNIIGLFEHTLEVSKTYIVGEITIQPIRDEYRYMSPKMGVEWVLRANSVIRAVTEDAELIPYPLLHSVPHREIVTLAGTRTAVDVMVAVTGMSTTRDVSMDHKNVPVQELTVADQSISQNWFVGTKKPHQEIFTGAQENLLFTGSKPHQEIFMHNVKHVNVFVSSFCGEDNVRLLCSRGGVMYIY